LSFTDDSITDGTFVWVEFEKRKKTEKEKKRKRLRKKREKEGYVLAFTNNSTCTNNSITDGTVVWVEFQKGELGTPITPKEMDRLLRTIYGDHIHSLPRSAMTIAEDPSQLYLNKPPPVSVSSLSLFLSFFLFFSFFLSFYPSISFSLPFSLPHQTGKYV